jgi:ABC-2 type transport system permease protein
MNIINKLLLQFALLPSSLYRNMGVNTKHLKIILTAKLIMDDRRPNTFHQTRPRKSEKAISAATLGTMILSGFIGCVFLFSFKISNDLVSQFTIYFSLYFVMLVSTLISDFTSVLIDVRDNYIIFPKPVSDKTFVLSRLLHIVIHITKIIIPMSLPAIIYLSIYNGYRTSFVFFVMMLLASTFSIFLINIIYLIILKFTSPKKFQVIISYVQIFMTIIIFAGYQIMVQQIGRIEIGSFAILQNYWLWLLPSYWFALSIKFFTDFLFEIPLITGAILTILVPPLSLWTVIKYFAPSFNQKLSLITSNSEESASPITSYKNKTIARITYQYRLSKVLAKEGVEQMGFLLTWKLTSRLRDFNLKVYPSIGYVVVMVAISFYKDKSFSVSKLRTDHSDTRFLVMNMVYFSSIILLVALGQIQFSEKFKAAWFYFTTPVKKPGLIFSGALKAVIFKFYIPIVLILSLTLISLEGFTIVPNIILGVCNVLLGCSLLSLIVFRNFPFSAIQQTSEKIGAMLRSMLSLGLVGLLGLLQYFVYNIPVVVFISIALSGLANWLLLDYIKNKDWVQVLGTYKE